MNALLLALIHFVLSSARCSWFLPYFSLFIFCEVGWTRMNCRKAKCGLSSSSRCGCTGLDFLFFGLVIKILRGIDISMTLAGFWVKILKLFESRSIGEPICFLGVSPFGHWLVLLIRLLLVQHSHTLIKHLQLLHGVILFIFRYTSEISPLFKCRWPKNLVEASLNSFQMLTWEWSSILHNLLDFLSSRLMNIYLLFTMIKIILYEKLA